MPDGTAMTVEVSEDGKLSLPAEQRRLLGVEHGGVVVLTVDNGELRIRTIQAVIAEIQKLAAPYRGAGNVVDDFIRERYEEEAAEQRK